MKKDTIDTFQDLAKSLQCNVIADGGNAYSVYTDDALRYNERLAKGENPGCKPAEPFLTCKIEGNCIISSMSLSGVKGAPDEMLGLITIALANHAQNGFIWACGGPLGLKEADADYNDTNRLIIHGMQLLYKRPIAGKFNADSSSRMAIAAGERSPFVEIGDDIEASEIKNFSYDFVLPPPTDETQQKYDELAGLLRYWNTPWEERSSLLKGELNWIQNLKGRDVEAMLDRIKSLGGFTLHWT